MNEYASFYIWCPDKLIPHAISSKIVIYLDDFQIWSSASSFTPQFYITFISKLELSVFSSHTHAKSQS